MNIRKLIFLAAAAITLSSYLSPPAALLLGLILAQVMEHPYPQSSHKTTQLLLKISVIGLGFGMNIYSAAAVGKEGLLFTAGSILAVLTTGYFAGRRLKLDLKTSSLISAGTAICGGSAIAALSPVMKASQQQISVALGTVFILNSIALFLFPPAGHWLHLSQNQFGLWCAIAIHDTSSVVGAASKYGQQALQIAATVKLARALWIVPISFAASYIFKTSTIKVQAPYFIALFVLAILANTYIPFVSRHSHYLVSFAKTGLNLTLFLIGSGLSFKTLKGVGPSPLLLGTVLWVLISVTSLYVIMVVL